MLRVLKGENPGDIPVEGVQITELYVNPAAAMAMGVTIPAAVARAKTSANTSPGERVLSSVAFLGAVELGLVYGLVALGVYLSFRVLSFPDLTVDGSFPLGAAVAATAITGGTDAWLATGLAMLAGAVAGTRSQRCTRRPPSRSRRAASAQRCAHRDAGRRTPPAVAGSGNP